MYKLLLLLCMPLFVFSGCSKKGCMWIKPEDEEGVIVNYANEYNIPIAKHGSGIYYQVIDSGYGAHATPQSKVWVEYTGKLLNGTVFEVSQGVVSFNLYDVIEGWKAGIPLIKKGGRIRLIIPSAFAYGCNGSNKIPPNAVLDFDVKLIDVR